jgi:hypothetical protein
VVVVVGGVTVNVVDDFVDGGNVVNADVVGAEDVADAVDVVGVVDAVDVADVVDAEGVESVEDAEGAEDVVAGVAENEVVVHASPAIDDKDTEDIVSSFDQLHGNAVFQDNQDRGQGQALDEMGNVNPFEVDFLIGDSYCQNY